MRLSLVLVVALACAVAGGHVDEPEHVRGARTRRFLPGWGVSVDHFFHHVAAELRHAWWATSHWFADALSWARRHPESSSVYHVDLPHGSGVVVVINGDGGDRRRHRNALVWDGGELVVQPARGNATASSRRDGTITLVHAGLNQTLPLSALAKYLSHVPAGSRVHVDVRGSAWSNLRVVLRVFGPHGEDQSKSVSVLLSTVLKELREKHAEKANKSNKSSSSSKKSSSSSSEKSKKSSSSSSSSKKSKSHKSSSKLRWDGHELSWASSGHGKHRHNLRRRLRVTQDGVSRVIPLSVIASHLKSVPAHSVITVEIVGRTLRDLRVLLHVRGHHHHTQTVSLLVSKLAEEAEAAKHGASAKHGPVRARLEEAARRKHRKSKKKHAKVQEVPVQEVRQV